MNHDEVRAEAVERVVRRWKKADRSWTVEKTHEWIVWMARVFATVIYGEGWVAPSARARRRGYRGPGEWTPRRRLVLWLTMNEIPWASHARKRISGTGGTMPANGDIALVALAMLRPDDILVNQRDTFAKVLSRMTDGVKKDLLRIDLERRECLQASVGEAARAKRKPPPLRVIRGGKS